MPPRPVSLSAARLERAIREALKLMASGRIGVAYIILSKEVPDAPLAAFRASDLPGTARKRE